MAAGDKALSLVINIVANDLASGIIGQIAKGLTNMAGSGAMGMVAGAAIAAGTAVVGIGASAIQAAGDFQQGMTKVKNLAAPATENIQQMGDALLKIAADTGQTPQHLADGLYLVESAGIHGSAALDLLTQASKAAAVGNVDMSVVADAATTAVTNFGKQGLTAGKAIDIMTATVSAGKMQYSDYAKSLSVLTTNAANGKVSFAEANAALATFTRTGQSSQLSAQHLGALFLYLGTQTVKMADNAKKLGISFDENAYSAMSLGDKVAYLNKITGGNFAEVQKLMGGNKTLASSWQLLANNSAAYGDILNQYSNSADITDKAFQNLSGDMNFQLQRLSTAWQSFLIVLGEKLLPLVTPFVKLLADMVSGFTSLISGMDTTSAQGNLLSGVFKALGVSGEALADLGQLINGTFGILRDIFTYIGRILSTIFTAAVKAAGEALRDFSQGALRDIISAINQVLITIDKAAGAFSGWLASSHAAEAVFKQIGDFLKSTFVPVWDELVNAIKQQIVPAWNEFVKSLGPAMPALKLIAEVIIGGLVQSLILLIQYTAIALKGIIDVTAFAIAFGIDGVTAFMQVLAAATDAWNRIVAAWNAAPDFFAKLWDDIKKVPGAAWAWIVDVAKAAWNNIVGTWNVAVKFFTDIGMAIVHGLEAAWNAVVKAAQDTWKAIASTATTAWNNLTGTVAVVIKAIADLFKWLYDHDYYFKDLVDFIKQAFDSLAKWATGVWQGFVNWLSGLWKGLVKIAQDVWGAVSGAVSSTTSDAVKAVQSAWTNVSNWLSDTWKGITKSASDNWTATSNTVSQKNQDATKASQSMWDSFVKWLGGVWDGISKGAVDLWNGIGHVFASAWNDHILPALQAFAKSIADWFAGVIDAGKKFGENLINGIVDGIKKGFGAIGQALHDALGSVLGALGLHNIPGFASGVSNFVGGWAVVGERGPELLFLPSGSSVIPSGSPPPAAYSGSSSPGQQIMIIYNELDGKTISKVVTRYQERELRIQGSIHSV